MAPVCPEPQFQPTPQRHSTSFRSGRCLQLPHPDPLRWCFSPLTPAARHHSTLHSQEATPVVVRRLLSRPRRSQRPGVTSVAQGRKRITLVSAFCASSSTALCVLPGPTSGMNGLTVCSPSPKGIPGWRPPSFDAPSGPPQPRGVRSSALSPHDAGTHWRAHFASSPTGTVCSRTTSSSHSLSVSRHSRLHASWAASTHLSLTTSLLRHCPGATSLRWARTASRTQLSKSPYPGGVTFCSLSSTSSCGSPSSPLLGSPVWSSRSSSVTATPPSSTLIAPCLSPLVHSNSSSTWSTLASHHTFHHSWTCRKVVSVGAPTLSFAASWTPCVSAIRSTPLLLLSASRKPSTLAGSKPRWFVSTTWASQVVSGTSLPISSAALCPRSGRLGFPDVGLTLASHKGGSSHLSCSTCWWTTLPPLSMLPSLASVLWTRTLSVTCANSTRTTWSSLLNHRPTFSMLWTSCMRGVVVGGSRLVSAPPNLRFWSSVLSAAAQIVPCILGASLSLWCHNTDTSVSLSLPLSVGVLTLTWSALVVIASSTKPAPDVVAKVCLSLSPHLSSLHTSFPVRHLVWSSSATTPQQISNSTSHSVAGAVIFLGGLSQQFTGSLVSAMHSALPSDVHSRCLVACVPWTTLPLALQTLPVSSGSVPPCKAHGRTRPLFVPFRETLVQNASDACAEHRGSRVLPSRHGCSRGTWNAVDDGRLGRDHPRASLD